MRDLFGFKMIGAEFSIGIDAGIDGMEINVIRLLKKKPLAATTFPYLVVSDRYDAISSKDVDLIVITDIDQQFYEKLKHIPSRKLGIEITISKLRAADGQKLAKSLALIKSIHSFTEKYGNQLVLTSGASSVFDMVSGRCFDALLKLCDINPETYWISLNNWLEQKINMRCYAYDA